MRSVRNRPLPVVWPAETTSGSSPMADFEFEQRRDLQYLRIPAVTRHRRILGLFGSPSQLVLSRPIIVDHSSQTSASLLSRSSIFSKNRRILGSFSHSSRASTRNGPFYAEASSDRRVTSMIVCPAIRSEDVAPWIVLSDVGGSVRLMRMKQEVRVIRGQAVRRWAMPGGEDGKPRHDARVLTELIPGEADLGRFLAAGSSSGSEICIWKWEEDLEVDSMAPSVLFDPSIAGDRTRDLVALNGFRVAACQDRNRPLVVWDATKGIHSELRDSLNVVSVDSFARSWESTQRPKEIVAACQLESGETVLRIWDLLDPNPRVVRLGLSQYSAVLKTRCVGDRVLNWMDSGDFVLCEDGAPCRIVGETRSQCRAPGIRDLSFFTHRRFFSVLINQKLFLGSLGSMGRVSVVDPRDCRDGMLVGSPVGWRANGEMIPRGRRIRSPAGREVILQEPLTAEKETRDNLGTDEEEETLKDSGTADDEEETLQDPGTDEEAIPKDLRALCLCKSQVQELGLVGRGAFGVVRAGVLTKDGATLNVAIKKMLLSRNLDNQYREFRLLNSFDHPQILGCIGWYRDTDVFHIVTELCDLTVSDWFQKLKECGRLSLGLQVRVIRDIAVGIQEIHSRAMAHRDIKPENVLISLRSDLPCVEFDVKICDFGLCKAEDEMRRSGTGFKGTSRYLPSRKEPRLTVEDLQRIDSYSFAILCYELLSLKTAFHDVPDEIDELARFDKIHRKRIRPNLDEIPHPEIRELCRRCWSPIPSERLPFDQICRFLTHVIESEN